MRVEVDGSVDEAELVEWVEIGCEYAEALPPK